MKKGFTLLEVIIVIAIIGVVSLVTTPLGITFYKTQTINAVQTQFLEVLSRARSQAVTQLNDVQYGVFMATTTDSTYTLFQGSSWGSHSSTYDEVYELPADTTVIFPADSTVIMFAKHTGAPTVATGTVTIMRDGLTRTITIDAFGNSSTP